MKPRLKVLMLSKPIKKYIYWNNQFEPYKEGDAGDLISDIFAVHLTRQFIREWYL